MISFSGLGQNLVFNGDFEQYVSCPDYFPQPFNEAIGWSEPGGGAYEYYNSCCTTGLFGVPQNNDGNEPAHSGKGYALFQAYGAWLQTSLSIPLTQGKQYYFEMFVSLTEHSYYNQDSNLLRVGVFFSNNAVQISHLSGQGPPSLLNPQIYSGVITNRNGWTKISGVYTANGGEKYITIGNYRNFTANYNNPYWYGEGVRYYLDDVSVIDTCKAVTQTNYVSVCMDTNSNTFSYTLKENKPSLYYLWNTDERNSSITISKPGIYTVLYQSGICWYSDTFNVTTKPYPLVNLGNDTTICSNVNLNLKAGSLFANYLWNTGSIANSINVNKAGKYWVKVSKNQCTTYDTINIATVPAPLLSLGNDTSSCFKKPFVLSASSSKADSYLWQNGSTLDSLVVTDEGKYWVTVKKSICVVSDTILITKGPFPIVNLGGNKKICKEENLKLDAGNAGSSYLWNDLSTSQMREVHAPGFFHVTVTNIQGCVRADSILLDTFISPQVFIGNDTTFCDGLTYKINAGSQFKSYLWQDASTNNFDLAKTAGNYYVIIKDYNNCSASDTLQISLIPKPIISINSLIKVCEPDLMLKPSGNFVSYLWQDGSTSSSFHINDYGNYSITVTDSNNCANTKSFEVKSSCSGNIFVPNAFTPNGDGKNETFFPVVRNVKSLHFEIYNRWGELLFETSQMNKGWDGTFQNSFVQPDVFVYRITYTGLNDEVNVLKGNVTLLK
ncbi:MAG: T9SS type B sorting domain-containing protein [Bacteroidia bacterium]